MHVMNHKTQGACSQGQCRLARLDFRARARHTVDSTLRRLESTEGSGSSPKERTNKPGEPESQPTSERSGGIPPFICPFIHLTNIY